VLSSQAASDPGLGDGVNKHGQVEGPRCCRAAGASTSAGRCASRLRTSRVGVLPVEVPLVLRFAAAVLSLPRE
jgi:hypothetical protein